MLELHLQQRDKLMTDSSVSPSIDPASRGDLVGTVRLVLTKFLQGVDDMLPATVIAYDRTTNRARVQPLISIVTTDGQTIRRAQVASIPVLQLGGGGFVLSFPIQNGDLGWIKANDRDISLFMQALTEAEPNTQRKHSFEDSIFIPDSMMRGVTIDPDDSDSVVLQSLSGGARIAIAGDKVTITAPNIILDSPLTTITGLLESGTGSGGSAVFHGTITATGEITSGTVALTTHVHSGVQPGSGDTGEPVP